MSGINRIWMERARQQGVLGYDAEHDDRHVNGELVAAAIYYAYPTPGVVPGWITAATLEWDLKRQVDRIEELTMSGALIAAEIDRLERIKEADDEGD